MDFGRVLCTHVVVVFSSLFCCCCCFLTSYVVRRLFIHSMALVLLYILYRYKYCVIIGPFVPFWVGEKPTNKYIIYFAGLSKLSPMHFFFIHLLHRWRGHKFFRKWFPFLYLTILFGRLKNLFGHAPFTFLARYVSSTIFGLNLMPSVGAYSVNTINTYFRQPHLTA